MLTCIPWLLYGVTFIFHGCYTVLICIHGWCTVLIHIPWLLFGVIITFRGLLYCDIFISHGCYTVLYQLYSMVVIRCYIYITWLL